MWFSWHPLEDMYERGLCDILLWSFWCCTYDDRTVVDWTVTESKHTQAHNYFRKWLLKASLYPWTDFQSPVHCRLALTCNCSVNQNENISCHCYSPLSPASVCPFGLTMAPLSFTNSHRSWTGDGLSGIISKKVSKCHFVAVDGRDSLFQVVVWRAWQEALNRHWAEDEALLTPTHQG